MRDESQRLIRVAGVSRRLTSSVGPTPLQVPALAVARSGGRRSRGWSRHRQ